MNTLNFYTTNPTLSWYVYILLGVDGQLYTGLVMKCLELLSYMNSAKNGPVICLACSSKTQGRPLLCSQ